MNKNSKIFIAGRGGFLGSATEKKFKDIGYNNIIGNNSKELDLRNQAAVFSYFEKEKPEYVILMAAKKGNVANNIKAPAEHLYDNVAIQNNVIDAAHKNGVRRLLFLASASIYPRESPQPIKENYLLNGKLETTDEGYALAKIVGVKLCEMYNRQYGTEYISAVLSNIYGIGDSFETEKSQVIPTLIKRFHDAKIDGRKKVAVWGSGNPRREFTFIDDITDAFIYLFTQYSGTELFNIGTGKDHSIKELAEIISDVVGYKGEIEFDTTKPDGIMRKLLDVSKINSEGWVAKTSLREGIEKTYKYYLDNVL